MGIIDVLFEPNVDRLKERKNVTGLIKVLENRKKDYSIRIKAAVALGELGSSNAVKPLINVLQYDTSNDFRQIAVFALGEIGDAQAVKPLIEVLRQDRNPFIRGDAAFALGRLRNPQAVGPLTDALQDVDYVRENALHALEKII